MTLKRLEELINQAKKSIYEKIKDDPRELEGAGDYFEGYFMSSLFREIFKSKNDFLDEKANKAFDIWNKTDNEIRFLKYEQTYSDIVKGIHEGSLKIKTQKKPTLPDQERH